MIKGILAFVVLSALIGFAIHSAQYLTGKQFWSLTKTFLFSILSASLAFLVIAIFVLLF